MLNYVFMFLSLSSAFHLNMVNSQLTSITQGNNGDITIAANLIVTGNVLVNGHSYLGYSTQPTGTNYAMYVASGGASISNLAYTSTCGSSCFASDEGVKTNIQLSQNPSSLERMMNVIRYKYQYMPGFSACDSCVIDGFIAQNVLTEFPDAVKTMYNYTWLNHITGNEEIIPQMYMLNYDQLTPHLWDAVLELNSYLQANVTDLITNQIKPLQTTVASLTSRVSVLETSNSLLSAQLQSLQRTVQSLLIKVSYPISTTVSPITTP
jgi:hypothetical protein